MKLFLDFVVEKGFDYKRETRRQAAAQCVSSLGQVQGLSGQTKGWS